MRMFCDVTMVANIFLFSKRLMPAANSYSKLLASVISL